MTRHTKWHNGAGNMMLTYQTFNRCIKNPRTTDANAMQGHAISCVRV